MILEQAMVVGVILVAIWAAFRAHSSKPVEPRPVQTKIVVKPKAKKVKPESDPVWKAAKTNLVAMGFSATEAKSMLSGLKCSTVEQYINQAMRKVKL